MKKQTKTKDKKRKGGRFKRVLLFLLIILLIAGGIFAYKVNKNGGGLSGIVATTLGHNDETLEKLPKMYCLLLGKSQNLTDTIMLASYDPKTQQAALLSIPRDTFIGNSRSNASTWDKINAVYQTGVENLLEDVSNLTGINVQYYIMVDTEALKVLVDKIGGVEFDVPIDMKYDDNKQGLHINLKAGLQVLDGDKAEQVVRFRHNNNGTTYPKEYGTEDVGRMKTQRAFLTALAKQTLVPKNIAKIPEFIDIAKKYVKTNLDFDIIKDYAPYAINFNVDNLKTNKLPGKSTVINGYWFYDIYKEEAEEVIDNLFFSTKEEEDVSENTNTISNESVVDENSTEVTVSEIERSEFNIEVLNGTDVSTNLSEAVTRLEKAGYKVTKTGKTNLTTTTTIINRKEVSSNIENDIKDILKNGVISNGQESGKIHITIILGTDYVM